MTETITEIGEFGLIARIDAIIRNEGISSGAVSLGIGDDTASLVPRPGFEMLLTCDAMVEGRHFLPASITPNELGRRAMTQNISDIGAMGGYPVCALVSLGLRGDMTVAWVEDLYRGFLAELNPFEASIAGGNITGTTGPVFVDITLAGEVEQGRAVRRRGAQPGDAILVTGYPGQSAAGLRLLLDTADPVSHQGHPLLKHYTMPSHRAVLGRSIGKTGRATAMIDTSDGFPGDLGHICEESGVGAEVREEKIPVSDALRDGSRILHREPAEFFLADSDDYELIVTCRPGDVPLLQSLAARSSVPLTEVGSITGTPGITLIKKDGTQEMLKTVSWDHFRTGDG